MSYDNVIHGLDGSGEPVRVYGTDLDRMVVEAEIGYEVTDGGKLRPLAAPVMAAPPALQAEADRLRDEIERTMRALENADETAHRQLNALSDWIDNDPANSQRDREAATWGRLAKVAEESGEVIAAYIALTGQNPRKGESGSAHDVVKELLDVALTALCAVVHVERRGYRTGAEPLHLLRSHIAATYKRAGLEDS